MKDVCVGFIGQGWIGKHYADDFEQRGYEVIRYSLEEPYINNRSLIKDCNIVFIAVPTPTTNEGFDDSFVKDALLQVGEGAIAVIKSTLMVGTTKSLQAEFPNITIMHSPEFLAEKTAAYDAAHPNRNLVGITEDTEDVRKKAQTVLDILPDAPYAHIIDSNDAELVKYAGNCFLFTKVIFMNLLYDLVGSSGGNWERVRDALVHDPRIGLSHTEPVHTSGHDTANKNVEKRGAGGHCFIKDFETFKSMYEIYTNDSRGLAVLEAMTEKNIELLIQSGKDVELVEGVFGDVTAYKVSI